MPRARRDARGGGAGGRRCPPPLDPAWNPERVPLVAATLGVDRLGDHHWRAITSFREEVARTGHAPGLEDLAALTGFDAAELQRLFPGDPAVKIARLAGFADEA